MRKSLFLMVLCSACSQGPQADAAAISQARSLTAEWALINQQAADHKLTGTYVDTMRSSIREELQTTAKSLTQPGSDYGSEIQAVLKEPDAAPAQVLRSHAGKLKHIEDSFESA
jgi:hypothetical protein